jgi:hypothetical protein
LRNASNVKEPSDSKREGRGQAIASSERVGEDAAMKKTPYSNGFGLAAYIVTLALLLIALVVSHSAAQEAAAPASLSADEAAAIATDAYIYGYPLVTMEYTRRVLTNVAGPTGLKALMGQFVRARSYPDSSFHDVTAPNADTL